MALIEELRRDAEHVDYEIWMLFAITERLRAAAALPSDEVARRAILESWLIHLRALYEFFKTENRKDRRAVDYFENDHTKAAKIGDLAPKPDSWEERRIKEIHKAVAHIVEDRARLDTNWSEWDLDLVTPRLRVFFELLEADTRPWFPRAARWFASPT